jgi:transcriptional regulator with XRE-family HTH domain
MKIQTANSNAAILSELGSRIKRARIDQQLTQQALASRAGVAQRTISVIENGGDLRLENLIRILRALGYLENFNTLLPELAINPEDYASLGKERQRVSLRRGGTEKTGAWKWGDET